MVIVGWVDASTEHDLEVGDVMLGYNVFAAYRRRGYATRAVNLMLKHLTADGQQVVVAAAIDRENAASLRVARKAGFTEVGSRGQEIVFVRECKVPQAP